MIVVVDDRLDVGQAYVDCFEREGVAATCLDFLDFSGWFSSISDADIAAIEAIVLGSGVDRITALRAIQLRSRAPVIALSDRRSLDETLSLFNSGFDDVVVQPVHARELLARSSVVRLRRHIAVEGVDYAGIVLFSDGRDPEVCGQPVPLPRRERRILECLARGRGGWVSKAQIFNHVYGLLNEEIDENVIESHISRLRKRMRGLLGYDPIESQRFLGYRLLSSAAVRVTQGSDATAEKGSNRKLATAGGGVSVGDRAGQQRVRGVATVRGGIRRSDDGRP